MISRKDRNILLDFLAVVFGISAWVSVNGLWVELPLLIRLPESWALASHLSIIVQIANIGPLSYSLLRWQFPNISKSAFIYPLLVVGTLAAFLLALLWDKTSVVFGHEHSTGLFTLAFFLATVDCTSSVLFMPYMVVFREIYLNSYLIGEGLSGFIPAIVALAQVGSLSVIFTINFVLLIRYYQGVGGNPTCQNVTSIKEEGDNIIVDYEWTAVYPEPRYDKSLYVNPF